LSAISSKAGTYSSKAGTYSSKAGTYSSKAGTYCLVLRATRGVRIRVGSFGTFTFVPGLYLYVGSARGPGGLRARIGRHLRRDKVKRWHIDYLTASSSFRPVGVFTGMSERRMEGTLVAELMRAGIDQCVAGFGSTDDPRVTSHLLAATTSLEECRRIVQRSFSRLFPFRSAFLALGQ